MLQSVHRSAYSDHCTCWLVERAKVRKRERERQTERETERDRVVDLADGNKVIENK